MSRFIAGVIVFVLSPALLAALCIGLVVGTGIGAGSVARHIIWQSYKQSKDRVLPG